MHETLQNIFYETSIVVEKIIYLFNHKFILSDGCRAVPDALWGSGWMEYLDDVLDILRELKKKHKGPLPLNAVFKTLINERICDSSKSVSECLRKLQIAGKIRPVNAGVNIELLEDVKLNYVQSSLTPFRK